MYTITQVPEWNMCLNVLLDPTVSELQINGPDEIFFKKDGQRIKFPNASFASESRYIESLDEGLIPFIRSTIPFEKNSYLYEGPLYYKAGDLEVKGRCHIVLPPASDSPQITIAKKSPNLLGLEDIALKGSMSSEMFNFLSAAVQANVTIVLSGSTGSGKTTTLEALTKLIRKDQRIGVAEDTPELVLSQPNVTYLHSVPWRPGMDPNKVATLSWVVSQFQRMRLDKIIVGETRGKEFADFLVAANSGMEGSLTTIHADDPVACLRKMTLFASEGSPNIPIRSINTSIANAIDLIVQLTILPNGKHRVSHIQEITPTIGNDESASITTNPLYKYDPTRDGFEKVSSMTDNLRKKFLRKNIDILRITNSSVKTISPGHGSLQTEPSVIPPRGLPLSNETRNL